MSREAVRPYLILKDDEGVYRITVRTTRYNSQGYPLVSSELLTDSFATQTAARRHVKDQFRGDASEIATKA